MEDSTKKNKSQILNDFLVQKKKVLISVLVVLLVAILTFGIVNSVIEQKSNEAVQAAAELDKIYEKVISEDNEAVELIDYSAEILSKYEGSIAELMVYSRLGSYYFDEKDFNKALENYTLAYTKFSDDLASSVYMFNAAMCLDELNRGVEAITILEELVKKYKSTDVKVADFSGDIPEALFNLGRLYEENGNTQKAVESYEILVAEYQSVSLSNLAKSRLIDIK